MSAKRYGDIMVTQTNVPTNKNAAYIKRVEVDSLISGNTEQQHRKAEPQIKYLN